MTFTLYKRVLREFKRQLAYIHKENYLLKYYLGFLKFSNITGKLEWFV